MLKSYPAVLTKEENGYSVIFPDFKGATDGDDLESALVNAKNFLETTMAFYIDHGRNLPKVTNIKELPTEKNSFVTLVQGNPSLYIHSRTVKKNVTIPEIFAKRGAEDKINFSEMLTDALFKKYMS